MTGLNPRFLRPAVRTCGATPSSSLAGPASEWLAGGQR